MYIPAQVHVNYVHCIYVQWHVLMYSVYTCIYNNYDTDYSLHTPR